MRRVTALCAAVGIAVSVLAAPAMAARHAPEAGYYVIRWNDTGVCARSGARICNTGRPRSFQSIRWSAS
jgi:hypothetical protein